MFAPPLEGIGVELLGKTTKTEEIFTDKL
jgi:hypothetical protein